MATGMGGRGFDAEAAGGEDAGSSATSMPVMSWRPTPKKRESFAARMRRMRKSGSEGLVSEALFGPDSGEEASGGEGEVGVAGSPDDPQWNMFNKGAGLAWKDMRAGYFSRAAECCDGATDWGIEAVEPDTLPTDCWLGEENGRPKGDPGRKSVCSVCDPFLEFR